jgi:hypothetical protein
VLTDLPEFNQVQPGTSSFNGYEFEPGISSHPIVGSLTVAQLMLAPLPTGRDTSFARPFFPAISGELRGSIDLCSFDGGAAFTAGQWRQLPHSRHGAARSSTASSASESWK